MRTFFIKLSIFALALVIVAFGVDYLIQEGIKTSSYREISKWNEVIQGGIDADILIVGSSRALVHFDPAQIEEKTGMTCYNLGLDGSKYEAQKKVLELYLEHNNKPKKIIWSLDLHSFQEAEGIYRYEQFIPFWSEPKVKEILALNQGMELDYLDFPIIKYSNNQPLKYRGLIAWTPFRVSEPLLERGFRIQNKSWDGKFEDFLETSSERVEVAMDSVVFRDFEQVCGFLLGQDIEVIWCVTPYYKLALEAISNYSNIIAEFHQRALAIGVPLQDLSWSSISDSKENFYNGSHLNRQGTGLFIKDLDL